MGSAVMLSAPQPPWRVGQLLWKANADVAHAIGWGIDGDPPEIQVTGPRPSSAHLQVAAAGEIIQLTHMEEVHA